MTGPSGKRLSICPLRFRIASPRAPRSIETLGEAILNLSGQIDLPITLDTSHYLFIKPSLNLLSESTSMSEYHNVFRKTDLSMTTALAVPLVSLMLSKSVLYMSCCKS